MQQRHFKVWPEGVPHSLGQLPRSLNDNLDAAARQWPDKPGLIFYDSVVSFARMATEVMRIAGFLEQRCGVARGDRVMLYMQSTPQFVLAYYGILRAGAVVVPVNPMNGLAELQQIRRDCGAQVIFVAQDLFANVAPLLAEPRNELQHAIVAAYCDYLTARTDFAIPDFIAAVRRPIVGRGITTWRDMLAADGQPLPYMASRDDLALLPYTSGSTGRPKGCMHSHASAMHALFSMVDWYGQRQDDVVLAVAPLFHVFGMQTGMNVPIQRGSTTVLLPRWDRDIAAELIRRYRITAWPAIPTMAIDLLSSPHLDGFDLSSIRLMFGGGVAMPEAIAARLQDLCGITFLEGYGLTETMAPVTANPPQRPKRQCGGIPVFDTVLRIVDPATLAEMPVGGVGEILVHGPQLLQGYWNAPDATAKAFVTIDGQRFFRTGDLGRIDADGYVFLVDRLMRMINMSGYKVWPAEVEALLYGHPAIAEACVVGAGAATGSETVKAVIVLKDAHRGRVRPEDITAWARQVMPAYKVPRLVEFVDALPKSASGKVQWLALQQRERDAAMRDAS